MPGDSASPCVGDAAVGQGFGEVQAGIHGRIRDEPGPCHGRAAQELQRTDPRRPADESGYGMTVDAQGQAISLSESEIYAEGRKP